MKKIILSILVFCSFSLYSQSFKVAGNVLSTSLYQPFDPVGGYTISYERMLDPGYSRNAAQFSYKLNLSLISDSKKSSVGMDSIQVFYDRDAYRYSGFLIVPEFKYYFTWNAPLGIYMNVFGSYSDYSTVYTDTEIGNASSYEEKTSKLGRGVGAGFQFKLFGDFVIDIVGGYHLIDISSSRKLNEMTEFEENPKEQVDKLYVNLHFGYNF